MSSFDWPLKDKQEFYDEVNLLDESLEGDDEVINDESRQKSRAFFKQATSSDRNSASKPRNGSSASERRQAATPASSPTFQQPPATKEGTLALTSSIVEVTKSVGQYTSRSNLRRAFTSPPSVQDAPNQALRPSAVATLQRSLTNPAPIAQHTSPRELQPSATKHLTRSLTTPLSLNEQSSLAMAGSTTKRKRTASKKATKTTFLGKRLLYIKGERVGLRRKRMELAEEHSAKIVKNLEDDPDYIIVDAELTYQEIKTILEPAMGRDPKPVIVKDEWPLICMQVQQLIAVSPKYQVKGILAADRPKALAEPPQPASQASAQSLQVKMPATRSEEETPSQSEISSYPSMGEGQGSIRAGQPVEGKETGTTRYPAVVTMFQSPTLLQDTNEGANEEQQPPQVPQRQSSGFSDELSIIMDNVRQEYQDMPRIGEEDANLNLGEVKQHEDDDTDDGEKPKKKSRTKKSKYKTNQKSFEENFACSRGGTETERSNEDNPNALVISVLKKMLEYYTQTNDHWRIQAYHKAIDTLSKQTAQITTAEQASVLPYFGPRLSAKLEEIAQTQTLRRLEFALNDPTSRVLSLFLGIYGVGQATAEKWIAQGFRTLDDLVAQANLNRGQRIGIDHYDDLNSRIPRAEVTKLGEFVIKESETINKNVKLLIGGSYRRGAATSGDIDFIVTKKDTTSCNELKPFLNQLVLNLYRKGFLTVELATSHRFNSDGSKWHGCCVLPYTPDIHGEDKNSYRAVWRRIDFLLVPESEYGAALIYFTGNDIFNRSMRLLASRKQLRLNQRGLYKDVIRDSSNRQKITEGELLEGRSEKRIFELLGVKWREPSQRWC